MSLRVELSRIASRARRVAWLRRMLIGMLALPVLWLTMALAETEIEWPVWVRLLAGWAAPLAVLAWAVMPLLRKADLGALARRLDGSGAVLAGLELGAPTESLAFEDELAQRAGERAMARLQACDAEAVVGRRKLKWPAMVFTLALAAAGGLGLVAPRVASTGLVRLADPLGDHPVWDAVQLSAQVVPMPDGQRVEATLDGRGVSGAQSVWTAPPTLALVDAVSGREVPLPATMVGVVQASYARTVAPVAPVLAFVRFGRARSHHFLIPAFIPPATPAQTAPWDPSSADGHQAGALPAWLRQVANLADALEQVKTRADAARLLADMAQAAKDAPPDSPATGSLRARLSTPALAGAQADPDATPISLAAAAKSDAKALRALAGTLGGGDGQGGTSLSGRNGGERAPLQPGTGTTTDTANGPTTDEALLKIRVEQAPAQYRDQVRAYFEALAKKEKQK